MDEEGIRDDQIYVVRVPKASILLHGVPASHEVGNPGAVQCFHSFIKRLFEPRSSVQLAKSLRGLVMPQIHVFLAVDFALVLTHGAQYLSLLLKSERKSVDSRGSKLTPLIILYGGVSWGLSRGVFRAGH
jgi:hypothetical protein